MNRKQRKKKALFIIAPIVAVAAVFAFLMLAISLSYTGANNFVSVFHNYTRELFSVLKTRIEGIGGSKRD